MNTIKIKLSTSGRIAALDKNFPLYQGQFQNVLLNIIVPTEILAPNFDIQHFIGQTEYIYDPTDAGDEASLAAFLNDFVQAYASRSPAASDVVFYIYNDTNDGTETFYRAVYDGAAWGFTEVPFFQMGNFAGTSVKIGAVFTKRNGVQYVSPSYYLRYVKTFTANDGIEYALYERKLPKVFTSEIGSGQNATVLVVNVVNVADDSKVESVITSQTAALDVLPSTELDQDPSIEPTALEEINAELGDMTAEIANKQDKQDNNIAFTVAKTVVGALNDLNTREIATNAVASAADARSVLNAGKIADLESVVGSGEYYVGTITITTDILPLPNPTNALNYFVQTQEGRDPKGGDTVIIIQKITDQPDKNYKAIFNGTAWIWYEIPPMEKAGNGSAGIVEGTYTVGATADTIVDITGGKIVAIYVKDTNGNYADIRTYLNTLNTSIADIIAGNTQVGEALRAIQDGLGNNIVNTYLTQAAGATKAFVRDYALPKEFNNVLYLSANGFSDEIPTTPADGIQFTATAGLGETLIGTCEYELGDLKMQLSRKNSYSARLFIRFEAVGLQDPTNTYRYKILTYLQKAGQTRTLLSSELLPETSAPLDEGYIRAVDFGTSFDELGDAVFDLENGDKIIQEYYFVQSSSFSMTVDIFSNSVYPSRMNLNTSTTTIVYRETEVGETIYISPDIADITRDAEFGVIDIFIDNDELLRLSAYPIPSNIVIHLPDLSGIAGISPSDRIIGISSTTPNYFFAIMGTKDFVTIEDLVPYRKTNGQYFVSGVVVDQGTIQLIAPNIMSIRGTLTLTAANWSSGAYAATVSGLQDTDDIFFEPNSADDEIAASEVDLSVVSTSGTTVNFAAGIDPTADITLKYTIRKN